MDISKNKDKKATRRSIADIMYEGTPLELKKEQPKENKNQKPISKGKKNKSLIEIISEPINIDKKILTHIDVNTHKKIKILSNLTNINMYVIVENVLKDFLSTNENEINDILKTNF